LRGDHTNRLDREFASTHQTSILGWVQADRLQEYCVALPVRNGISAGSPLDCATHQQENLDNIKPNTHDIQLGYDKNDILHEAGALPPSWVPVECFDITGQW